MQETYESASYVRASFDLLCNLIRRVGPARSSPELDARIANLRVAFASVMEVVDRGGGESNGTRGHSSKRNSGGVLFSSRKGERFGAEPAKLSQNPTGPAQAPITEKAKQKDKEKTITPKTPSKPPKSDASTRTKRKEKEKSIIERQTEKKPVSASGLDSALRNADALPGSDLSPSDAVRYREELVPAHRMRLQRERSASLRSSDAGSDKSGKSGKGASLPSHLAHHIFISHCQASGGDQAAMLHLELEKQVRGLAVHSFPARIHRIAHIYFPLFGLELGPQVVV